MLDAHIAAAAQVPSEAYRFEQLTRHVTILGKLFTHCGGV